MLRIGMVGAGAIGDLHLGTFPHLTGARLVGIADSALDRAQMLATKAGVPAHDDYRALIGEVDAVWVCTPPFLHAQQTNAFADAGIHVFCEKPMAVQLEEADAMIAACRRARVRLMVGQVIRYYPETLYIKRLLDGGELGDVVLVFGHRLNAAALRGLSPWARDEKLSGGFAVESGVHEADTVRFLAGEVESVYARVRYDDPEYPGFDTDYRALLRLRSGATGEVLESRYSALGAWAWGVVGTKQTAVSARRGEVRLARMGEQHRTVTVDPVTDAGGVNRSMLAENQAFVDAIRADREPPIPGKEGRRNLEVVLAGHRSEREQTAIQI